LLIARGRVFATVRQRLIMRIKRKFIKNAHENRVLIITKPKRMVSPVLLLPDRIFKKLSDITAAVLVEEGVKGLILDIDYTLAPKSMLLPEEAVKEFIENLKSAGVGLYIISNNHRNRVSRFAQALGLPYICNGLKPFPRSFLKAARRMGLEKSQVAAVGDQIYTDVFGAHAAGIRAFLILPGGMSRSFFYRLRGFFEKPFINRYYKNEGGRGR
jgi:HAD superfamily phosphatase (TIGR01668 family)